MRFPQGLLLGFAKYPLWYLIKYFGFFISFWLLAGSFFSLLNPLIYPLGLALGVLAYKQPKIALYIFLVALPIFGNRPPEPQTHYLIVLSSFLIVGLYAHVLIGSRFVRGRFIAAFANRDITLLFIFLWFFVSLLSLIGLPLLGAIKHSLEEHWYYTLEQILIVGELTLFYSFASVFFSVQAMMIGAFVYGYVKSSKERQLPKKILLALLAGFFFSIIAGHLDYFGIFSLDWTIRGAAETNTRLTSFFTNSSWYAQYLAVLLPLMPILLLTNIIKDRYLNLSLIKAKIPATVPLLLILLVIGEVTLILAMQRGAWITYPPTLFFIWLAIYYAIAKSKENRISFTHFFKKNWLKIFVTIPLTITLSIFIVYAIKDYQKNNHISVKTTFEQTASRAEAIANTNDRLQFWPPALQFFKENPIFGGGGDSFGWQYKVYYMENDRQIYKENPSDTLQKVAHGTSHNMYLQSLTGRGIFGILFLLGFLTTLIYRLTKFELSQSGKGIDQSIIALSIIGAVLASMIYGNVQEIFYSQSVQIIFWTVLFIGISLLGKQRNYSKITARGVVVLLLLLPVHIISNHFIQGIIF